ncbi:J domain-containing protein [Petralouisia muris]|uniref:J domain-containing protein n=1 Tax=Petralouisia muris TaxID=3032872 RepID=A0AC61RTN4_9FIRM|nr:J domain-containing protein [Petralouisia muris]TGY95011.1 J domain-containing protein [Petralouisia muris]
MAYFNNINTLEQLRKQYRDLLKIHHPDNGGNVSDMQEINAEYDKLFKLLKDRHENKSADRTADSKENNAKTDFNNMKYDFSEDAKLREVLQQIITFEGINIEIVGCWIWIDGNTYLHKDTLKKIGFKWAREKKKWYFHTEAFRKRSHKKLSMEDIRNYYGSTEIETDGTKRLKQAFA